MNIDGMRRHSKVLIRRLEGNKENCGIALKVLEEMGRTWGRRRKSRDGLPRIKEHLGKKNRVITCKQPS
jgi:hypothetical protein